MCHTKKGSEHQLCQRIKQRKEERLRDRLTEIILSFTLLRAAPKRNHTYKLNRRNKENAPVTITIQR